MNRKHFLTGVLATASLGPLSKVSASVQTPEAIAKFKIPPYLKPGDRIAITCPAGSISRIDIEPALIQLSSWGLIPVIGKTVGAKDFTFGGTDQERLEDLQHFLGDPSISAILCARGGYGAIRILDQLRFDQFVKRPKWLIGFSDITILHTHIHTNFKVATIHSKMCNSFPSDWAKAEPIQIQTINSIREALMGNEMVYQADYQAKNRIGSAKGVLVGGNLRCIENLAGTPSEIDTEGKILFLEDTGEYLYSIDRMLFNLKRSDKLKDLAGLVIGGFKVKPDDEGEEFGQTIEDIVWNKVAAYNYPVCFGFPVGHQRNNFALKCGVEHRLDVGMEGTRLTAL